MSRLLYKAKVYYHVCKSPSLDSVLCNAIASSFFIIHPDIILPNIPSVLGGLLTTDFTTKIVF